MDSKIFHKFSYGLYVIGSTKEGKFNAQIANTVFQITSEPATVAISINKKNLTHQYIQTSKVFSVSILPKSVPLDFIGHFGFKSGRDIDKYQTIAYKQGETGAPILLEKTVGYLEAEVINSIDLGTHTLFIGRVINAEVNSGEESLTYDYYQQLKRGATSKTVPIQTVEKKENKEANKIKKYVCQICEYVYDPIVGDPDSGIAPGTAFEDIPEDWVCPTCGVSKDQFEPLE